MKSPSSMIAERYRIVRLLGQGAASRIFLAVDQSSRDAEVAVKLLGPRHSIEQRTRFKKEFAALSRASHPHLVRAFDFGASGPDLYYTSEVIRGDDLASFLTRKENAKPQAVVEILAQVASALEHLRRRDLAHGDLRPSNILCARTPKGISVKLIDLGLTSTGAAVSQDLRSFGHIVSHLAGDIVKRDERLHEIIKRMTMTSPGRRIEDPAAVIEALRGIDPSIADEAGRDLRLFGRDTDLRALKGMLEATESGKPHMRVAMVHGEAGSGRSALLEQVRIESQLMGFAVGFPHLEADDRGPYQYARSALGMLVSAGYPPHILGRRYADPVELKFAVTRALLVIAERTPVALLFDDLDQADPDSRELVEHLAGVLAQKNDVRMTLAISGRQRLIPSGRSIDIPLAPLAREDMSRLAGAFSGSAADASLVDGLMDASTGNAGLARELLEASRDRLQVAQGALRLKDGLSLSLPRLRVEDASRRMGGLSPEVREAAEMLALARGPLKMKLIPPVGKNSTFWISLETLFDAGIADAPGDSWRIASPPLRRAIIEQIPADRQRELHRRLATSVDVPSSPLEFDRLEMLAHHWIECGDVAQGEHWGMKLAEKLVQQTSFLEGAEIYRRTADLHGPQQAEAWEGARMAARYAGRFERMVEMARRRLEVDPSPEARLALAQSLTLRGELPAALAAYEDVTDGSGVKPGLKASAHLGRAAVYHIMRRAEEQKIQIEAARKVGDADPLAMTHEEGCLALNENRFSDAASRFTEALPHSSRENLILIRLDLLRGLAAAQVRLGMPNEAIKTYEKAEKSAFSRYMRVAVSHYEGLKSGVLEASGSHLKAMRIKRNSIGVAIEAGRKVWVSNHAYNLANLEMLHGDTGEAEKAVALCMEAAGETNEKYLGSAALSIQAVLHGQRSLFKLAGTNMETALHQASPASEFALARNQSLLFWMSGAWKRGFPVFKNTVEKFLENRGPIDAIPVVLALYEARLKLKDGSPEPLLARLQKDILPWDNDFARGGVLLARAMDDLRRGDLDAAKKKTPEILDLFQRNVGLDFVLLAKLIAARTGKDHRVDLAMDVYHEGLQRGRLRFAEEAAEMVGDRALREGNPHLANRWHHEALRIYHERQKEWFDDPACKPDIEERGRELASKPTASPAVAAERDGIRLIAELERDMSGYELLDPVLQKCMKSLLGLTGGERAMILLENRKKLYIRVRCNLPRLEETAEVRFCRTVANDVWKTNKYFHTANAAEDMRLLHAPSPRELKIRSILCLPLSVRGKAIGVIYIDNRNRSGVFESVNLDQIETIRERVTLLIHQARLEQMYKSMKTEVEKLRTVVRNRELSHNPKTLRVAKSERPRGGPFAAFTGESKALCHVLELIQSAANTDSTVLILGETGTGKELAARALHEAGRRNQKPFLAINCAAIPEATLESELFGHVRGAFTGADRNKAGLFQAADGGTLFLDEIGELSFGVQAALLRALETGEVRRVGGVATEKVDVRIVAASNKDLLTMSKSGKFRSDLLYRLKVLQVIMPPLRERNEDIPLLVDAFEKDKKRKLDMSPDILKELFDYGWPGNVRELKNVVDALHVIPAGKLSRLDVRRQLGLQGVMTPSNSIWDNIALAEKTTLLNVLKTEKTLSAASRRMGIVRSQLYRLIHKYDLHQFLARKRKASQIDSK